MREELIRLLTEYGWREKDYPSLTDEELIKELDYTLTAYSNSY
jgi:hypothetical protein